MTDLDEARDGGSPGRAALRRVIELLGWLALSVGVFVLSYAIFSD